MIPNAQAALLGLADEDLVMRVRDLAGDIDHEQTMDAIFAGLDELLERFAPDVNRRAIWRELEEEHAGDPSGRAREMDGLLDAIDERARWRPLARQLEGTDRSTLP